MSGLIAFCGVAMFVMASLGLFMSGVAAIRQARLSKKMFDLRFPTEGMERSNDFDFRPQKASNSHE